MDVERGMCEREFVQFRQCMVEAVSPTSRSLGDGPIKSSRSSCHFILTDEKGEKRLNPGAVLRRIVARCLYGLRSTSPRSRSPARPST